MVFSKGVIPFMIMTRFKVGTKKISKIISSIITIFPIKIIFNSTYRLIFKIIMNAIKLTILNKFMSVRIKVVCSGQVDTCRGVNTTDVRVIELVVRPLLRGGIEERVGIDMVLGDLPRFRPLFVLEVKTYSCFLLLRCLYCRKD